MRWSRTVDGCRYSIRGAKCNLRDFQMTFSKTTTTRLLAAASMAVLAGVLIASGGLHAQTKTDPNTVLAKGAGVEVKQSDLDLADEEIGAQLQGADEATKREQLIDYLISLKVVAKAA